MNRLLLAATTALMTLAVAAIANATPLQLTAFGQTSSNNTLVATANGGLTSTNLSIANARINISQLFGSVTPIIARFHLDANSTDAAQSVLGFALQHYSGSFCLTSVAGCLGTNYLSGTFSGGAAVGKLGGVGLVVNVAGPPDLLSFTSSVIPSADLGAPNTLNLSLSNVHPALAICGNTLCSFGASFAGTVSSTNAAVREPASLAMMGVGLLGFAFFFRRKSYRRRKAKQQQTDSVGECASNN